HRRIGMKEVVPASGVDTEQQVQVCRKRRRLPGFIRAVDDMQVRPVVCPRAKEYRIVREDAVAREVQPIDAHHASPSPATACRRPRTSSAPSATKRAMASRKLLSSDPRKFRLSGGKCPLRSSTTRMTSC